MSRSVVTIAAALLLTAAATSCSSVKEKENPFMQPYDTPYGIPPFESIEYSHYLPAIKQGIEEKNADIQAIIDNPEAPDFDNTILAFEKSGQLLNRVMRVFMALNETNSSEEMTEISNEAMPLYQQTIDGIMMNQALFDRVRSVYDSRMDSGLSPEQIRAVEELYRQFVRNGALLSDDDKKRLSEVNTQLTDLFLQFNRNLLDATNQWQLVVDSEDRLAGIPASNVAAAAEEAKSRGMEGKWVFTLHAPSRLPLLQSADDRDLRRQMYEGYMQLASSDPYDNRPVINKMLKLRSEKARLLGYPDFASYMTANVMAKTPKAAEDLLMQVWGPATKRVAEEVAEMQALADSRGDSITIAPYDYYYYAEKVRKAKYDLNEDDVRPYFAVDSVLKGIFTLANRLHGITFTEIPDAPKYHPEVKVYDVRDAKGEHVAVFMTDYFPRASKRQGAWMDEMQSAFVDPDGTSQRPIVYNVGNFSRPTADAPALLTLDEVATMFHEFGHGMHGMLTRAKLRSQAGTNVDRDFVELPSQITEHWALEPELLKEYAHHYKTGEVIPDSLITKLNAASAHNAGFNLTERLGASLLDLEYGHLNPTEDIDIEAFEKSVAQKLNMPLQVQYRYRSPYFRHIFGSDGYASGYYTYTWAEVLDTDGFELFKERGIFDPETARSFRENVLERGGEADPMELYIKFRGHEPSVDALLRHYNMK